MVVDSHLRSNSKDPQTRNINRTVWVSSSIWREDLFICMIMSSSISMRRIILHQVNKIKIYSCQVQRSNYNANKLVTLPVVTQTSNNTRYISNHICNKSQLVSKCITDSIRHPLLIGTVMEYCYMVGRMHIILCQNKYINNK
jgi:hypothetical protein